MHIIPVCSRNPKLSGYQYRFRVQSPKSKAVRRRNHKSKNQNVLEDSRPNSLDKTRTSILIPVGEGFPNIITLLLKIILWFKTRIIKEFTNGIDNLLFFMIKNICVFVFFEMNWNAIF